MSNQKQPSGYVVIRDARVACRNGVWQASEAGGLPDSAITWSTHAGALRFALMNGGKATPVAELIESQKVA